MYLFMHSLGHFEKYSLVHISLILHLAQGSADGGEIITSREHSVDNEEYVDYNGSVLCVEIIHMHPEMSWCF